MSWRTVNLGDLVENFSVRAKDHVAETSSLEFCGVSNSEGITLSKYAAENKAEDYKIIEKDCFAYNPYRINVGSIGLLESDTVGLISPAYVVFKPKPKSIIPQLLLKFLKSSEGLRQIKLHARGTVRQALRFEDLCKIELSIPDYNSQLELYKRIEETEIETSVLINELSHQLSLVKQLRQAFLREAMQGKLVPQDPNDEPASVLLEKIKAEKEQLIKENKIKKEKPLPPISEEEIPFEIPENWVWCHFGELCALINGDRGKNYPNRHEYVSNGIPWINTGHIQTDGTLSVNEMHFITKSKFDSLRSGKIQRGDLVYCLRGATFGKTAFVKPYEIGAIASSLMIIRLMSDISNQYAFYFLKSDYAMQQLYRFNNGSAQPNLAAGDVNLYFFPLPPLSEQQRIVTKLDELMKMCDNLETSTKESQQQNELLLQQVLREALEPKN